LAVQEQLDYRAPGFERIEGVRDLSQRNDAGDQTGRWNDPVGDGGEMGANARFFRAHVLELPIHQDLGRRHISHIARQVSSLATRMAA